MTTALFRAQRDEPVLVRAVLELAWARHTVGDEAHDLILALLPTVAGAVRAVAGLLSDAEDYRCGQQRCVFLTADEAEAFASVHEDAAREMARHIAARLTDTPLAAVAA